MDARLADRDRSDLDQLLPDRQDRHHADAGQPHRPSERHADLDDVGVAPIAGVNGGQSTFVGGDAIGISRDSKVTDQAWNFISWLENDDAQVEVVAKGGNVVARTDLAANQYTAADPRMVLFNPVAGRARRRSR